MGRSISPRLDPDAIPLAILELRASQTWTAPGDGFADLLAFGAGGSGGVALGLSNSTQRATGAQAGGTVFKRARVRAGEQIVFTLGTGGAARSQNSVGTQNGNPGNVTTITGPGFSITIPGGLGGLAAASSSALTPTSAAAPTGGDINLLGGLGGAISAIATTSHAATGGGAPATLGPVFAGGAITAITTDAATGGAGVGGNGAALAGGGNSGGGGSGGAASGSTGGPANTFGTLSIWDYLTFPAAGSNGINGVASTAVTTAGAGSGSAVTSATGSTSSGAVFFAGSGAVCCQGFSASTGAVSWGGASGGACGNTANVSSGKGGDALALLAFYPD